MSILRVVSLTLFVFLAPIHASAFAQPVRQAHLLVEELLFTIPFGESPGQLYPRRFDEYDPASSRPARRGPGPFCVSEGRIYLFEREVPEVLVYALDGSFERAIPMPAPTDVIPDPTMVALDARIYFLGESIFGLNVIQISEEGEVLSSVRIGKDEDGFDCLFPSGRTGTTTPRLVLDDQEVCVHDRIFTGKTFPVYSSAGQPFSLVESLARVRHGLSAAAGTRVSSTRTHAATVAGDRVGPNDLIAFDASGSVRSILRPNVLFHGLTGSGEALVTETVGSDSFRRLYAPDGTLQAHAPLPNRADTRTSHVEINGAPIYPGSGRNFYEMDISPAGVRILEWR